MTPTLFRSLGERLTMRTVFKVFAAFASVFGICGVALNFLVCFVYFTNTRLLDAPNVFILNITLSNLFYSLVALPLLVAANARGEWLFGDAGCTAYGFLTTFFGLGSMMNLVGAACERCITFYKLYKTGTAQVSRRKALLLSSVLWCYSFVWSFFPILGWSSYVQEGVGTSCSIDWESREAGNVSYAVCLILACFVVPVGAIIFCLYKSYTTLGKLGEQAREQWGEKSTVTQETVAAETKMAWIGVVMTTGFLFAWTPYTIASIIAMYDPGLVSDIGASIPAYIAKSSACYNPFICMFMHKKLRKATKNVLRCGKKQVHLSERQTCTGHSAQTRNRTTKGDTNLNVQSLATPNSA